MEMCRFLFQFNGDINEEGNIRIKETDSYYAEVIVIPMHHLDIHAVNILSTIMQEFNTKLRKV